MVKRMRLPQRSAPIPALIKRAESNVPWKDPADLSVAELAYMAGLVDGEGSICIFPFYASPHQANGVRYLRHQVSISVANTNLAMVEWIAERLVFATLIDT